MYNAIFGLFILTFQDLVMYICLEINASIESNFSFKTHFNKASFGLALIAIVYLLGMLYTYFKHGLKTITFMSEYENIKYRTLYDRILNCDNYWNRMFNLIYFIGKSVNVIAIVSEKPILNKISFISFPIVIKLIFIRIDIHKNFNFFFFFFFI